MSRLRLAPCLVATVVALGLSLTPPAHAAGREAFSEERFRALQDEGALVLVDVSAEWCPTCARQADVLARYREARPEVSLHVLRVDFDAQKEWVTHFKAPRQSTLILFRGHERRWFSVAETDEATIFAAIDEAAGGR